MCTKLFFAMFKSQTKTKQKSFPIATASFHNICGIQNHLFIQYWHCVCLGPIQLPLTVVVSVLASFLPFTLFWITFSLVYLYQNTFILDISLSGQTVFHLLSHSFGQPPTPITKYYFSICSRILLHSYGGI